MTGKNSKLDQLFRSHTVPFFKSQNWRGTCSTRPWAVGGGVMKWNSWWPPPLGPSSEVARWANWGKAKQPIQLVADRQLEWLCFFLELWNRNGVILWSICFHKFCVGQVKAFTRRISAIHSCVIRVREIAQQLNVCRPIRHVVHFPATLTRTKPARYSKWWYKEK
jgi:hypothetical protein